MGVEIRVEGLTKSFGRQLIWGDVSLTLPAGEISVLLGPSGTGKSVFLKTLVGLLRPDRGSVLVEGRDITRLREHQLFEVRKLFGVLFQDGALFGSMSLFDNIAFPLREHTRRTEREVREIVGAKMEMVGLLGSEKKLPGEISGGMRKRAGLARALVLDPQIVLFDEPDSGLDPVRTAYLNQLIVDLNEQIEATFLIVTHDINTARTVPDNIGLLYHQHLAMFGPREMLLSSQEPVVRQFLNAQRQGPIGMAEEKDADELAAEAATGQRLPDLPPIPLQLPTSAGSPRHNQRPPGEWCRTHGVTPPPGSFRADATTTAPATPAPGAPASPASGVTGPGAPGPGAPHRPPATGAALPLGLERSGASRPDPAAAGPDPESADDDPGLAAAIFGADHLQDGPGVPVAADYAVQEPPAPQWPPAPDPSAPQWPPPPDPSAPQWPPPPDPYHPHPQPPDPEAGRAGEAERYLGAAGLPGYPDTGAVPYPEDDAGTPGGRSDGGDRAEHTAGWVRRWRAGARR